MYSNTRIIQNLRQSLFQDDKDAFNKLFGPFIVGSNSYAPDSINITKDIDIKNEMAVVFYSKNVSDNNEEAEVTDDDDDEFIDYLFHSDTTALHRSHIDLLVDIDALSHSVVEKKKTIKPKASPKKSKKKAKASLKKKVYMV